MPVPVYHHPSLTVLVDDSASFLRSLAFQLDPSLPRKAFHDACRAIDWVRQQSQEMPAPEASILAKVDTYPAVAQQHATGLNLDEVCRISSRPIRFMTPTVLVVDYSMPQMNGIEFCEALSDLPCKKILLTGIADQNVAVAAFNRGLIHRYIRKNDDDALQHLGDEILALQRDYFSSRSEMLRGCLLMHDYHFVTDPAVSELVGEICLRHRIVEHYLFPNPAGVLLLESNGCARLLVVESESGMDAHVEVARDNGAPLSLSAALEERRVVPNFFGGDGMYAPEFGERWHRHTQPAQVCEGRERYYWAVFDIPPDALRNQVASFSSFLNEHPGY
jgi:CheY-like chemotaxis protein